MRFHNTINLDTYKASCDPGLFSYDTSKQTNNDK